MNEQVYYSHPVDVETKAQKSDSHLGTLRGLVAKYIFDLAAYLPSGVSLRVGWS